MAIRPILSTSRNSHTSEFYRRVRTCIRICRILSQFQNVQLFAIYIIRNAQNLKGSPSNDIYNSANENNMFFHASTSIFLNVLFDYVQIRTIYIMYIIIILLVHVQNARHASRTGFNNNIQISLV